MKPKHYVLLLAFLASSSAFSQISQKGIIKLFNSNNRNLSGVEVKTAGSRSIKTDVYGLFNILLNEEKPGKAILTQIFKSGFEVVNEEILRDWIVTGKNDMKIVMAPAGTVQAIKSRYHEIAVSYHSRIKAELIQRINDLYKQHRISLIQRKEQLNQIVIESRYFADNVAKFVDRFARINPDDVTDIEKRILQYVNEGNLDKALDLYLRSGIVDSAKERIRKHAQGDSDISEDVELLYRYADLCGMCGGTLNQRRMKGVCKFLVDQFPNDYNSVFKYTLTMMTKGEKGYMDWIDRCLQLAPHPMYVINLLNAKVTYYCVGKEVEKAQACVDKMNTILYREKNAWDSNMFELMKFQTMYARALTFRYQAHYEGVKRIAKECLEGIEGKVSSLKYESNINQSLIVSLNGVRDMMSGLLIDVYEQQGNVYELKRLADHNLNRHMNEARGDRYAELAAQIEYEQSLVVSQGKQHLDWKKQAAVYKSIIDKQEILLKHHRLDNFYLYAMNYYSYVLAVMSTNSNKGLSLIEKFKPTLDANLQYLNEGLRFSLLFSYNELYTNYYRGIGNQPMEWKYTEKLNMYADKLKKIDEGTYSVQIMMAKSWNIDRLIINQQIQKATEVGLELESMYEMSKSWGYENSLIEKNIATALLEGGYYQLGVQYMEAVVAKREADLRRYPNHPDFEGLLSSAYINLSNGYGKLKRYSDALNYLLKGYRLNSKLFKKNFNGYATNQFIATLNLSMAYYNVNNIQKAKSYLDVADALANELKSKSRLYESYPDIAKFTRGALYQELGSSQASKFLDYGLSYRKGRWYNDSLLLYLIQDYRNHDNHLYHK